MPRRAQIILTTFSICALTIAFLLSVRNFNPHPTTPKDSGIEGLVIAGPNCPPMAEAAPGQCDNQPYPASFAVKDIYGEAVAVFSTDENGSFKLNLRPGYYDIGAIMVKSVPHFQGPQHFSVNQGEFTKLKLQFDNASD